MQDLKLAESKYHLYLVKLSQLIQGMNNDQRQASLESFLIMIDQLLVNEKNMLITSIIPHVAN